MQNKKPVVGVVVPIYKVDMALVEKCLISIVNQTYKNIEIIIVDDGNEVEYVQKLKKLVEMDDRITMVSHTDNKGLFMARLTGVENSSSKYIAFVDADDSITIDWIRLLVLNAEENNSDIVMGRTVNIDENGWRYIFNANNSFCNRQPIYKEKILNVLMEDKGLDFTLHTMWNKLYTRSLWQRAWSDLSSMNKHLIMTEDILFSFILFYHAEKMSFSNHDAYLYYRNDNSSTISSCDSGKIQKNIDDLNTVFSEVTQFLKRKQVFNEYEVCWLEWKNRYFRWWSYTVKKACEQLDETKKEKIINKFLRIFDKNKLENSIGEDSYFGEKKVGWNNKLETIKRRIASKECQVVSFDLFDTLIVRPVLNPDDVFDVVLYDLNIDLSKGKILKSLRKLSECEARRKIVKRYPQYEDVTLSEIYDSLCNDFDVPYELCTRLREQEELVEIEFAKRRQVGYELYTLAQECGKKIFVTSDMYLGIPIIEKILKKNGYDGCKVLLSSEQRLLKTTGHLFEKLIFESKVEAKKITHIGDNWESDYIKPQKYGISSYFIPKTKDILLNYLGNIETGNAAGKAVVNIEGVIDTSSHFDSFAVRCMYANVANHMFDNPYVSFYGESDFNGDPYYLGNFAVGMHMFGLAKWLSDLVDEKQYHTVHFVARDGFYLRFIYDRIRQNKKTSNGKSNYLYASRKAFIPLDIESVNDIEKIYASTNYSTNTVRSIIGRYASILKPISPEIEEKYKEKGFLMDKPFENENQWINFIETLKEIQYSEERAKKSFSECQKYLKSKIKKDDIIFDLGYSGKLHSQMIKALGFSVDGAYVNFAGYDAIHRNNIEKLNITSYYDFIPCMHGIITEYIFSDRRPSCIGYENGKPIFEKKNKDSIGDYVITEINRGAYNFTDNFISTWSDRMSMMDIMPVDSGLQFEKFLVAPTKFDQAIFNNCCVEDEYYGGIKNRKINEIWAWQLLDRKVKHCDVLKESEKVVIKEVKLESTVDEMEYKIYLEKVINRKLLIKALYWLCVNKTFFWSRVKDYLNRRK